jgi:hypothetical protein
MVRGLAAVFAALILILTPSLPAAADPGVAGTEAAWEFI